MNHAFDSIETCQWAIESNKRHIADAREKIARCKESIARAKAYNKGKKSGLMGYATHEANMKSYKYQIEQWQQDTKDAQARIKALKEREKSRKQTAKNLEEAREVIAAIRSSRSSSSSSSSSSSVSRSSSSYSSGSSSRSSYSSSRSTVEEEPALDLDEKMSNACKHFIDKNAKYFTPEDAKKLQDSMDDATRRQYNSIKAVKLKDPTAVLVFAIIYGYFGLDRLMLDDMKGLLKLFTIGGFGIWWIADIFTARKRAWARNYELIKNAL